MERVLTPAAELAVARQTRDLLHHYPPRKPGRYAAYAIDGGSNWTGIPQALEAEVFGQTFGNSVCELEREYGRYDRPSLYLTIVDAERCYPAGVLRVIRQSPAGLKTLADVEAALGITEAQVCAAHGVQDLHRVWDVGTLAVRRGSRGEDHVSVQLYAMLHMSCLLNGVEHVVTVLDDHAHARLKMVGVPFAPICGAEPFAYMGSAKSHASIMRVSEAGPSVDRTLGDCWLAHLLARGDGMLPVTAVP